VPVGGQALDKALLERDAVVVGGDDDPHGDPPGVRCRGR